MLGGVHCPYRQLCSVPADGNRLRRPLCRGPSSSARLVAFSTQFGARRGEGMAMGTDSFAQAPGLQPSAYPGPMALGSATIGPAAPLCRSPGWRDP